jgi:hypothetical protein
MATATMTYRQSERALSERVPFSGHSTWAQYIHEDNVGHSHFGMLSPSDTAILRDDLLRAALAGQSVYVVRSYQTPIAWAYGDVVRIPEAKYSVTTSKAQGHVRRHLR